MVAAQETLDFLFACSTRERQTLAKLFKEISSNPFQAGDYEEFDNVGRPLQLKSVGTFLITFWADHAAKEVRVVKVEKII